MPRILSRTRDHDSGPHTRRDRGVAARGKCSLPRIIINLVDARVQRREPVSLMRIRGGNTNAHVPANQRCLSTLKRNDVGLPCITI